MKLRVVITAWAPALTLSALTAFFAAGVVGFSPGGDAADALYILGLGFFLALLYLVYVYLRFRRFQSRVRAAGASLGVDPAYISEDRRLSESGSAAYPVDLPPISPETTELAGLLRVLELQRQNEITQLRRQKSDFADYLTAWTHEIKTPLSTLRLLRENMSAAGESDALWALGDEIERMESLVAQVLFTARAESFAQDYLIANTDLDELCRGVAKRNARGFVLRGIQVGFAGTKALVLSDAKWLAFVVQQIVANALSYTEWGGRIDFSVEDRDHARVLSISDTGIGIRPEDLGRVFDRGFTGSNGRKTGTATGMGLYLAKRLAKELGHDIAIESVVGKGTRVDIVFRSHSDYLG